MSQIIDPSVTDPKAWWIAESCTSGIVAIWNDSSTSSPTNRLVQIFSTATPTCEPNMRNGLKGIVFDGSDDWMSTTGGAISIFTTDGLGTVIAVVANRSTGINGPLWSASSSGTRGTRSRFAINARTFVGSVKTTDGVTTTASAPAPIDIGRTAASTDDIYHVVCWQHTEALGFHNVRSAIDNLDDDARTNTAAGIDAGMAGNALVVGRGAELNSTGALVDAYAKMVLLEMLVWDTNLPEDFRRGVQLYLTDKYAISYKSRINSDGSVAPGMAVEMKFNGVTWTDVTADVRVQQGLRLQYGMGGTDVRDRVAQTGMLFFALDNSAANSAGLVGYYSPDHANARSGFDLGCHVRVYFEHYGTKYYKWSGRISDIEPSSDPRESITRVVATDFMDDLARTRLRAIPAAVDNTASQTFASIVDNLTEPPESYIAGQGTTDEVFPYALDSARDEDITALSEVQRLTMSEFGYCYIRGDDTAGGKLVFESRDARNEPTRTVVTQDQLHGLRTRRAKDRIINRAIVTVHPRRVDASTTPLLYSLESAPAIAAGASLDISCPYRDPENPSSRVGGADMVTPASTTHYKGNTLASGAGTSLTTGFSLATTFGGNTAYVTVTNGSTQDGFLTKLNLNGRGIYSYEETAAEATSTSSVDSYGLSVATVDMPYQDDPAIAAERAAEIVALLADPRTVVEDGYVKLNSASPMLMHGLSCEIGDRIGITDTLSGLSESPYYIHGVSINVRPGPWVELSWLLLPTT